MDSNQFTSLGTATSHKGQRSQITDHVAARFQHVAAEGQNVAGAVQIIHRDAIDALSKEHSQAGRLFVEAALRNGVGRTIGGHKAVDKSPHLAPSLAVQESDGMSLSGRAQLSQLVCHQLQGLVPRNFLPVTAPSLTSLQARVLNTLGAVEYLGRCLSF